MPNGSIDPSQDYVANLSHDTCRQWPTISSARSNGIEIQNFLRTKLQDSPSNDFEIVVFGSLARREWTSGSDVDWTLLVDGQADPQHRVAAREVERILGQLEYNGQPIKGPGAEGAFGNMTFGHDIVHHIGGQADTNRNTTQRVLLLLEATGLGFSDSVAVGPAERISRQILYRYLASDSNFHSTTDNQSRIPRFLLNDIVRYWRTMCVDFAYKDWEQAGSKWAIRNIKLRTSRKLLFVAGLMMIFSCFKNPALQRDVADNGEYLFMLQRHLLAFVHSTPLDIVVWAWKNIGLDALAADFLDSYEQFLATINDPDARERLGDLRESVYQDDLFLQCRAISHNLQATLRQVCFDIESPLREFMCEYGVF